MRPVLPSADAVLPYLRRMDASGRYSNRGPLVVELERRYAEFLGVEEDRVVAASSATSALTGAVTVAGCPRWLVPDFTFPAPGLAALAAGADLTLLDASPVDWQLCVPAGPIGAETGLLPVLPFGVRPDVERWPASATVVVDAASSMGAAEGSLARLPHRWAVVFSLHATKVLPAGEGGLAVFGSAEGAAEFRRWANFGFDGDGVSRVRGQNAKLSEVGAAYGLASLDGWPQEQADWLDAQRAAHESIADLGAVVSRPGPISANPFWVVQCEGAAARDRAEHALSAAGIESRRWWGTLHAMPAFAGCAHEGEGASDHLARTTLGLPMFRGLGHEATGRVRAALLQAGLA